MHPVSLILFSYSDSFPSGSRLLEERERSTQLPISPCPAAQCYNPILLEVIRSCLVRRYHSLFRDVCMESKRCFSSTKTFILVLHYVFCPSTEKTIFCRVAGFRKQNSSSVTRFRQSDQTNTIQYFPHRFSNCYNKLKQLTPK